MSIFDHINKSVVIGGGAAFIIIVGGFIYYLVTESSGGNVAMTHVEASPLQTTLGRDLLKTLARLKSTKIDTSIFSDPVFTSLKDFGVTISSQPVGRRNPFAPIGTSGGFSAEGSSPGIPTGNSSTTPSQTATPPAGDSGGFSGFDI
ncbi:MAG: hypothetical protein COV91_05220 [Candidatus Taylorbacteria bacterium CG11_big_fil_rev_8_21_14_0_20_46_11]|uniref:Uncharacterized protein n=1 Tax=Candidatus Taylorbacteria bacterium CG11_big_fil_rev_8_21_14_0_20_46_11 TaxID=1975025 RepID=A0A2H0KAF7_9BACT|nr:MAG: hypothetical protein COV91_05220 [Candidatus Taylorbacteria bacterium CG11_big_fil_rev_8_21_14_0_20_46_11]